MSTASATSSSSRRSNGSRDSSFELQASISESLSDSDWWPVFSGAGASARLKRTEQPMDWPPLSMIAVAVTKTGTGSFSWFTSTASRICGIPLAEPATVDRKLRSGWSRKCWLPSSNRGATSSKRLPIRLSRGERSSVAVAALTPVTAPARSVSMIASCVMPSAASRERSAATCSAPNDVSLSRRLRCICIMALSCAVRLSPSSVSARNCSVSWDCFDGLRARRRANRRSTGLRTLAFHTR